MELPQAKFHGTVITRENFLEWRKKFEEEMKEKLGNKDSSSASQSARLTGDLILNPHSVHF